MSEDFRYVLLSISSCASRIPNLTPASNPARSWVRQSVQMGERISNLVGLCWCVKDYFHICYSVQTVIPSAYIIADRFVRHIFAEMASNILRDYAE